MIRPIAIAVAASLFSLPTLAQWPAGTPEDERGSRPSPMGTPAPTQELETETNERGEVVTEDGRKVRTMPRDDGQHDESTRHSSPGGTLDEGTDAGKLE